MYLFFLSTISSYCQSSGIQISWNFSVGCQVYSNEDPRDGKDPIFIENIGENECLLTCSYQAVTYTLSGNLGSNPDTTWSVNGGTITAETETTCTITWGTTGNGSLSFTVNNGSSVVTKTICIEKIARPRADFKIIGGASLGNGTFAGCSRQTLYFENTSQVGNGSPIMSYYWQFGDGMTSTEFEPSHVYSNSGTYTVALTVINACGCSSTQKIEIKIDRRGFDIECPSVVCEGETAVYSLPFDGREICRGAYNWSVVGGTIQNINPANGDVTVVWDQVDANGFGYVTFNPRECSLSCLLPTTIKVPVILSVGTIVGSQSICLGKQYKYTLPQWPTTDFQWEIIDGNNGDNVNIILTDQRNEIFLEPRTSGTFVLKVVYKNTLLHCGGIATLEINVNKPLVIEGPEVLCKGSAGFYTEESGQNGNWTLANASGSTISYLPGSSNFSYVFTAPGNYLLTISGVNNCASEPKLIKVVNIPTAPGAITGETLVCPGVPYTYSVSNYDSTYTYQWLPPVNGTIQGATTGPQVVVVFNTNSTHGVSVIRSTISPMVCNSSASSLVINNKQIPVVVDGPEFVCGNSSSSYEANRTVTSALYDEGETYTWSLSDTAVGSIISGQDTNSVTVMWNNVSVVTTVRLHCLIQKCTLTEDFFIDVVVRPTPTIAISGYNGPVCSGVDIPLTVVSTDPLNPLDSGSVVSWTANLVTNDSGLNESFVFENTTNGNSFYTIAAQIMNPNGCGNATNIATLQVEIKPAPDVSISLHSGENAFCYESQINSELTVAVSNNATVEWFLNGTTGLGITSTTYYPTTFGAYTVVATNPLTGCTNISDPFLVYQLNCNYTCVLTPAPQVTNTSTVSCNGNGDGYSTIVLSGTASQSPYAPVADYYDILGPTSVAGYTGATYPVTEAGIYNVIHRAKYVCDSGLNIYEKRKDLLVPYIPQFNYGAVCNGAGNSSFTISVSDNTDFYSPVTNHSFEYYIKPAAAPDSSYVLMLSTANGTFATTFGSGSYTIRLVVGGNYNGSPQPLCEKEITFSLQTIPNMSIVHASPVLCHDTAVAFNISTPIPNLNYLWDFGSGVQNTLEFPQRVFETSGNHTVNLTVTNRLGCERILTPVSVTIPEECFDGDIVSNPTNATVCDGGSVTLTYVPNGTECGATYQWMNELTPVVGATGINFTTYSEGVYWVKLASAQNCTYSSPSRIAPVFRTLPTVQLNGNLVFCENNTDRIIKAVTAVGNSISWQVNGQPFGNSTQVDLAGLSVGSYTLTVIVTDSFGCQNSLNETVDIIPVPNAPVIDYSLSSCTPYVVDVFVTNASSNGFYNWSNGMTGTANPLVNGGPLEIMVTEGGCTVSSQIDVPKDPQYFAWIFPSGCIDVCEYEKEYGYLIGPRLALHSWNWLQDYQVAASGTQSFPEPFEVTQSGIYNLSYNTGLCNFITEPLDYTLDKECDKCRAIKDIVVDKLIKNETKFCSFTLDLKIDNGSGSPITFTVVSPGPDVVITPSTVTLLPGAHVYSFTVIPVNLISGGSVTLFFEGIDAEGKPCLTDFTFTLPSCDGTGEQSKLTDAMASTQRLLQVVPNPAKLTTEVQFASAITNPSLELYDLTGRLMDSYTAMEAKGYWRLTIDQYPTGVYIVVLRENGQVVQQQKLVKE